MKNIKKLLSIILTVCLVLSVVTQTLMPVPAYADSGNIISTVMAISTVAGTDNSSFSGDNGPAVSAGVSPKGVAVDGSGNLYIADHLNNRIRRVDHSTGFISTVAGNGTQGCSGDNGPAVSAQLNSPYGVAVDGNGNLYIADYGNNRIRRVDHSTGFISTVAGTGTSGFGGDNGLAISAQLNYPTGVAVDGSGNLYIADRNNNRIRRVDPLTGNISTVAGTGTSDFGGDDGLAISAQLNHPNGVAVDGGNLYIADTDNHRIRRVEPSTGNISTVAGTGTSGFDGDDGPAANARLDGPSGVAVDGNGNLYISDTGNNRIRRVEPSTGYISTVAGDGTLGFSGDNGLPTSAQLDYPNGVAVDGSGNLYIAEWNNCRVRLVAPASYSIASISDQTMTEIAAGYNSGTQETRTIAVTRTGTGYLENLSAALSKGADSSFEITQPQAATVNIGTPSTAFTVKAKDGLAAGTYTETVTVSADSATNVTFTVTQLVTVSPPTISTVAGNGTGGFSGDNGPATSAKLSLVHGVAVDGIGNLYIADTDNHRIRRVEPSTGYISTVAGNGTQGFSGDNGPAVSSQLIYPSGVSVDGSGNLYIADTGNHRIRKVDHTTGIISTVAGTGTGGFSGDNSPATSARLNYPNGVTVDVSGNLYIVDAQNNRIRKVDHTTGNISTVAGYASSGFGGDNGPATSARLNGPSGVAVDGSGNLYIADYVNNRIRRVDSATGYISTVVGTGTQGFSGDNGPAVSAWLNHPTGVAVDGSGNLYIADYGNNRIRRVNSSGWISTVAGDGTGGFSGDNGPAANARLYFPLAVAVDGSGNLYIADSSNGRIRRVTPVSYTIASIGDQTMTDITAGYTSGTQETKTITLTRTGTGELQNLAVAISGGAGSSFEITQPTAAALNTGTPSTAFTVKAKDGLTAGTYTETVTVSADSMTNVTFTVTQVVTVSLPGAAPTIQSAVADNAHVSITWTGVTGATGYKIFKSTVPGLYSSVYDTVNGAVYSYDVTGLTNGVTYYFIVKASNGSGDSPGSAEVSAIPKTVPGAPTSVTAISGNGQATISFTAPVDNGGSAITGYIVTSNPGNITAAGTGSLITLTGLNNGTAYTFTVTATNVAGTGAASAASSAVVPTAPFTPAITISTQPAVLTNVTESGISASLTVAAAVHPSGTPAYEWFSCDDTSHTNPVTTGVTTNNFTIPTTLTTGNYYYYCEVRATGATPVNSNVATVAVNSTPSGIYSISFDANGGTGIAPTESNKAAGATFTAAAANSFTPPAGKQFKEWNTATNGNGNSYIAGATVTMPASNLMLYAIWEPVPAVTSITVAPPTVSVQKGNTKTFTATVNGTNSQGQTVTWSVYGNTSVSTTINASGVLTVAADETAATLTVTATSTVDNSKSGTATVTVTAAQITSYTITASADSGGSTTPVAPAYNADVNAGNGWYSTLKVTVDKKNGSAGVDVGTGSGLISDDKTTVITVPSVPDVDNYTLGIPVSCLSAANAQGTLAFNTDTGSVTIPSNMLTGVKLPDGSLGISGGKAQISIGKGDKSSLTNDVKAIIGNRPLVQLTLSIDGKQANWNNSEAPVTVSIPYTPTAAELANPESIVIWYIDGSGNVVTIPNGHYDKASGTVIFATTHFNYYAVGYNKVSFSDTAANAWYYKAVSFIAARSITTGTGSGKFSPDAKLTRGEFIVMLMKAYNIAPDENSMENFSDAGSTYYTSYLATAKRLGISGGVGNNMYAPGKEITRQEMFTLLYNALRVIDRLPQGTKLPDGSSGKSLSNFSDAGQIASWAKDAMTLFVKTGIVSGSEGMLRPADTCNRAQMAQVLYNLLIKLIRCSKDKNSTSPDSPSSNETKVSNKTGAAENSYLNKAVSVGKIVSITLDENITTGYSWHYSIENSDFIKFDSESASDSGTTDTKDSKPVMVGAGSKHTWNFKGVKQGTTIITFKYYRSWEGEKADVKTAEYTIRITEQPMECANVQRIA